MYAFNIDLGVDAMSLVSALGEARVKAPAEEAMLVHLLWLRELLEHGVLRSFSWLDTRDMSAEAHTKGGVDRTALTQLASGFLHR